MDGKKQFWKGLAAGFVITLIVVEAAVFGGKLLAERKQDIVGSSPTENGAETSEADLTKDEIEEKLKEIETVMNRYYLDEIDSEQVENYLFKGAVAGLGDAYAVYYTKEEYQSMMESVNGSYCGIGVEITQDLKTGVVAITRVFEGTPAMEAGLLPGDVICKVGEREATGEDLTKIVTWIKGEEHTRVTIRVLREEEEDYLEFEVERRTIEVPTVEYEMLENQIGYIALSGFEDVTANQFLLALDTLENQGMEALIVDLRNNGGGLVSCVCTILDRLLPEGLIVYTEDKYGQQEEMFSDAEHAFDKPLAVLVNENSASASEIFAGAVKDYGIGTLVGTTTYGKGIVQKIFPLHDGTAVKLTVSKYYTPKGQNIHGIGIEPDVEVELEEELKNKLVIPKEEDNQLQKALEVLE